MLVSTHAPARGATGSQVESQQAAPVSTHAPARGATNLKPLPLQRSCFNSRPRTGGDAPNALACRFRTFQLTPPHGGRPSASALHFNAYRVSTHAPARGATVSAACNSASFGFNSRPRTGGDGRTRSIFNPRMCFNSRPRTGGDPRTITPTPRDPSFNSRPRTGGDDS